jgi:hypothetical protein
MMRRKLSGFFNQDGGKDRTEGVTQMRKAVYHLHNYLQRIVSESQRGERVAFGTIRIGDVSIKGFGIWKSFDGRLSVSFPEWKVSTQRWDECVSVPDELREQIEVELIDQYDRDLRYDPDFDGEVFVRL